MSVPVKGRIPTRRDGKFTDIEAAHIAERLRALERGKAGSGPKFTVPGTPTFGAGAVVSPGAGGGAVPGGGAAGVTDHGALIGLGDDDHGQYVDRRETVPPHAHGPYDVSALETRFVSHGERVFTPHTHGPQDLVGLDHLGRHPSIAAHTHTQPDVVDLVPGDAQFVLAARVFGG